jgi:predicted MFS family arabinose efflux permease
MIGFVELRGPPPEKKPVTIETLLAGFRFIWRNPVVLGAISLDLFAMLLGGVTALLPVYAKDVLETGPWGLGMLRTAPALGALAVSIWLAHYQIEQRIGRVLFVAVVVFGVASTAFAFSTSLAFSMFALAIYGAADAVSVVIRHSLVQTRTPDDMLGRVLAVNSMFTGTSGTLGEFRAGAIAALYGAFASVLIGGLGAIAVAVLWMRIFPELARIDTVQDKPVSR